MKIGPNHPCPCGSGKKFKKCCQRINQASSANCLQNTHDVHTLLQQGNNFFQQGQSGRAIECFRQAVAKGPNNAICHYQLAFILAKSNATSEAISHYTTAIKLNPRYTEAYNNLGNLYRILNQLDKAEKCFVKALKLAPNNALIHNNLGNLKHPVNAVEAAAHFRNAIELEPDYVEAHSNLLVSLNYLPDITKEALFKEHCRYAAAHENRQAANALPPITISGLPRRLKVGYISPDFRQHPIAHFIEPVYANHDRNNFEIFSYYNHTKQDYWTDRLKGLSQHWHDISGVRDSMVASLIRKDEIDILVDLSGHTANNRLQVFMHRPAPVQVSWLGYPCTSGLSSIDYYITDGIADTHDDQRWYTERLEFMKTGFSCYSPPQNAPEILDAPAIRNKYVTFGSLNLISKINSGVLDLWCRLLHEVEGSEIYILRNQLKDALAEKILHEFTCRGISQSRVLLKENAGEGIHYLHAYNSFDILLDTFPWNGHTTACESLWMGVPVICMAGDRHAGRLCSSVLHQIGHPEFIARDNDDYIQIAKNIAVDIHSLQELRITLRNKMQKSALCDGKTFTLELERLYLKMADECAKKTI